MLIRNWLARQLCRICIHPVVETGGGGMGDAKRCLVCGIDTYLLLGVALITVPIEVSRNLGDTNAERT